MTPGVAREHVRVAKALRRMPRIAELFRDGRLSYSKVREVTRVVDVVDETRLSELALTATASQLARMISGYRSADGARISQQTKRQVAWHEREHGMIDFRARAAGPSGSGSTRRKPSYRPVGHLIPGQALVMKLQNCWVETG